MNIMIQFRTPMRELELMSFNKRKCIKKDKNKVKTRQKIKKQNKTDKIQNKCNANVFPKGIYESFFASWADQHFDFN